MAVPAICNVSERGRSHGQKAGGGVTWLLISGAGRSGTTYLNMLLNTHPRIALFTETGLDAIVASIGKCLATGHIVSGSRGTAVPYAPVAEDVDLLAKSLFENRFGKEDLAYVGDKMPNVNAHILSIYKESVSRLKTIYIVRRPSEVVPSSLKRREYTRLGADSWHVTSVEDAIIEWVGNWEHAASSNDRSDTLVVSYERYEHDVAHEIARIASFLDVDAAGFSMLHFTRDPDNRYTMSADEAGAVRDILGPVEEALMQSLEDALETMPRIYPKIAPGSDVSLQTKWPLGSLIFKSGFSVMEDWGIWTDRHDALMGFRLDPAPRAVRVSLNLTAFMGNRPHFDLLVKCNAQPEFQRFRIEATTNRTLVSVDCAPRFDGTVEVHLHMPFIKTADEEPSFDPRGLGIGLFYFRVDPLD